MKIQWKKLILCILIPLGVGLISALLTKSNMQLFDYINKPPLAPPKWLFPVVWSLLYITMGISSYLVYLSPNEYRKTTVFKVYALQLFFNFLWSLIFFNMKMYLFSFIWLLALLALIILQTVLSLRINKTSGLILLPYIAWVVFAGYLNLGIYILN